jgi:hypothetical protein
MSEMIKLANQGIEQLVGVQRALLGALR